MSHLTGTATSTMMMSHNNENALLRIFLFGLISFLTVVDLFGAQAILPTLVKHYGVTPAAMGFAVNASTFGMAVAGLGVAFVSQHINRRNGIWINLALLSIPTTLLAFAPDLTTFTLLRVIQGVFMASAFALTMAYLAEQCSAHAAATTLAACITGNVASNLFGRLLSASAADHFGIAANFYAFAALNLLGAVIVFFYLSQTTPMSENGAPAHSPLAVWKEHLSNPALQIGFGIGFLILFVFIGTFTYVNFVLVRQPIGLSPMSLGLVYVVFLPSIFTTPLAGRAVARFGTRPTFWCSLALAGLGLPLLLLPSLSGVIVGLVIIGVGTFFAQATATGFISRAATVDRGAASGLYLASYFLGGLVGSAVLGQVFDRFGWGACVAGIGLALLLAVALAFRLKMSSSDLAPAQATS